MPWFPLYTRVNSERRAAQRLEELGFEVLLPLEKRRARIPGWPDRVSALFPRYIFVKFHVESLSAILAVRQIVDVLRINTVPAWVPETAIESLRLAVAMELYDYTKPPKAGMLVELGDGPLAGFLGRVKRASPNKRVRVLVEFLGGLIEVDVPVEALREAG
jgi:transcription antitermination factor NusG